MTSNDRTERTKTMRNPCLTAALDELVKVGIQHLEIANGGKHLQIRWTTASGQRLAEIERRLGM